MCRAEGNLIYLDDDDDSMTHRPKPRTFKYVVEKNTEN